MAENTIMMNRAPLLGEVLDPVVPGDRESAGARRAETGPGTPEENEHRIRLMLGARPSPQNSSLFSLHLWYNL